MSNIEKMSYLELKLPPVVVLLLFIFCMWLIATKIPFASMSLPYSFPLAIIITLIGAGIAIAGVMSFQNAKTTVNPVKPQASTSIVASGMYQISRNPMYLGFVMILIGLSILLSNSLAFMLVPFYVLYMNRFQIIPEERILADKFGDTYLSYKQSVRRWL